VIPETPFRKKALSNNNVFEASWSSCPLRSQLGNSDSDFCSEALGVVVCWQIPGEGSPPPPLHQMNTLLLSIHHQWAKVSGSCCDETWQSTQHDEQQQIDFSRMLFVHSLLCLNRRKIIVMIAADSELLRRSFLQCRCRETPDPSSTIL
jgi:hypothetical protein